MPAPSAAEAAPVISTLRRVMPGAGVCVPPICSGSSVIHDFIPEPGGLW
jgi:hypothetical protein